MVSFSMIMLKKYRQFAKAVFRYLVFPCHTVKKQYTERVQVAAHIGLPVELLRRSGQLRSHSGDAAVERGLMKPGDAEINEMACSVCADDDILRLDVAVDERGIHLVHKAQQSGQIDTVIQCFHKGEALSLIHI